MEYDDGLDFKLIGRRVRDFRQMRGLTQEKLAEVAELSVPYVSHIERSIKRASLTSLMKIATALGVTANDFLYGCMLPERDVFCTNMQMLLEDCSQWERQTLFEITAAVKRILRDAA